MFRYDIPPAIIELMIPDEKIGILKLSVNTEQILINQTITLLTEIPIIFVDYTNWMADANIIGTGASLRIRVYMDDDTGTPIEILNAGDTVIEGVDPTGQIAIFGLLTIRRDLRVTVQSTIAPTGLTNTIKYYYCSYKRSVT